MGSGFSTPAAVSNCCEGAQHAVEVAAWFRAAERGDAEELWHLAEGGLVPINATDSRGLSALMMAASAGHEACVKFLLRRDTALNACDKRGWTAVTHAAFNGRNSCLQMLAERGANLDVRDFLGTTPAMRAALAGHVACLQQLAAHGADLCLKDSLGMEALVHARRNGHKACVCLLEEMAGQVMPVRSSVSTRAGSIVCPDFEAIELGNPTLLPQSGQRIRRLGSTKHPLAKAHLSGFSDEDNRTHSWRGQQQQRCSGSKQSSVSSPYASVLASCSSGDYAVSAIGHSMPGQTAAHPKPKLDWLGGRACECHAGQ